MHAVFWCFVYPKKYSACKFSTLLCSSNVFSLRVLIIWRRKVFRLQHTHLYFDLKINFIYSIDRFCISVFAFVSM